MSDRRDDLIEERFVPSGEFLGGRVLSSSDQGLIREIRVVFCEYCRKHLKLEEVCLCGCSRRLCDSCMRAYDGRKLCMFCLMTELPIRKIELMVLEAIQAGIRSRNKIAVLARITRSETARTLQRLRDQGCLSSKGVSIFAIPLLTNKALAALRIYSEIYEDADLLQFRTALSGECDKA